MPTSSEIPHDPEAETSLVGTILAFPYTLDEVDSIVSATDFYDFRLGELFAAAKAVKASGEPVDAVAIARRLGSRFGEIGGAPKFNELMGWAPHDGNAGYYAGIVRDDSDRRKAQVTLQDWVGRFGSRGESVSDQFAAVRKSLDELEDRGKQLDDATLGPALLDWGDALAREDELTVLRTGWMQLDEMLDGGFRAGQLCVLAARPSVGKSACAACMSRNVAESRRPVVFVSLEQSRRELVERLISTVSHVPHEKIRRRELDEMEISGITDAQNGMAGWPLCIDDTGRRTVSSILSQCRRYRRRNGLGMVVIDYLQLLMCEPEDRKAGREVQVSSMSRGVKLLAKELEVPVILLAQLNREVEKRDNKRPRLSDLRESGAIEQDADIVMFLHRPADYDQNANPTDAELIVAKNRSGKKGMVKLTWRSQFIEFVPARIEAGDGF